MVYNIYIQNRTICNELVRMTYVHTQNGVDLFQMIIIKMHPCYRYNMLQSKT